VRRVFIMDDAEQFLPQYLRFVKGIVDSSDLPLNVSRELLQQDPEVDAIRGGLTKRVLDMLAKLMKDEPEKYATFWKEFGAVLKEGLAQDHANKDRILPLLRFVSTHEAENTPTTTLAQYVERMKPGQERIYFLIAESIEAARSSPYIEQLKERGLEVLLLSERIDEWVMGQLDEFEGKKFKDTSRGDLELGPLENEEEKKKHEEASKESEGLLKRIKDALGERVEEVRTSVRLRESPAILVLKEHDMGASMRRIMAAAGQKVPESKPALEINAGHPIVKYLDSVSDADQFKELAQLLYDQASLAEGGQIANPADYVQRLNRLLVRLAGLSDTAPETGR
jgi:molecular chaperone HtpG